MLYILCGKDTNHKHSNQTYVAKDGYNQSYPIHYSHKQLILEK